MVTDALYDRPQSPGRRYVDSCLQMKLAPEPILLRRNPNDRALSLAHFGIGGRRLSALAESLGSLPGVNHLDLSDCRIEDHAIVRLLDSATSRPSEDPILSLKLSENKIGALGVKESVQLFVRPSKIHTRALRGSPSPTAGSATAWYSSCAKPVHNRTCTAHGLHNRLGVVAGRGLASMLRRNGIITDLNVSWNNIRGDSGVAAEALTYCSVRRLNMAMNAFGRCYAALCSESGFRTHVEYLDHDNNHLTPLTVSILMNGLALRHGLKF